VVGDGSAELFVDAFDDFDAEECTGLEGNELAGRAGLVAEVAVSGEVAAADWDPDIWLLDETGEDTDKLWSLPLPPLITSTISPTDSPTTTPTTMAPAIQGAVAVTSPR
jgi:hypothetical protein